MTKKINESTREGFELGYHMARIVDTEEAREALANGSKRCATCAFRQGTYPNGSPTTLMDVTKCIMEGIPFLCHEESKPCAGWVLMRRGMESKTTAPWNFSDEPNGWPEPAAPPEIMARKCCSRR